MGMGFSVPIGADVPVHVEIGAHAALDELGSHEVARHGNRVGLFQFPWQRELDLARELCVLDRAAIYGALLGLAQQADGEKCDEVVALWRRRGKWVFEAEAAGQET